MLKGKLLKLVEQVKDLEEKLIQRENDNKKFIDSFIANISHEIRTPLNAIVGFSGLLNSRELPDNKKEQFISHINDSSERLLHLIENIMELSFYQSNSMKMRSEECNLSEILKSAFYYINHLKEKNKKSAVAIVCEDVASDVDYNFYSDGVRILLVLRNLLNNAIKFTDEGFIEFGCSVKNDVLEFYVKDTGKGIKNSNKLVFENFYKEEREHLTGSEGLGIGLSVCKGIIKNMNGEIWFTENNHKGSTFYFSIPYIKSKTSMRKKEESSVLIV